jgi:hypothetical protein
MERVLVHIGTAALALAIGALVWFLTGFFERPWNGETAELDDPEDLDHYR